MISKNKFTKIALVISLMLLSAYLAYSFNLFGFRLFIENSNLLLRRFDNLSRSDSFRIEAFFEGVKSLFIHPFGGLYETRYYHNMWLDAGRIGGIFSFVLILAYSVITTKHAFKLITCEEIDIKIRFLIIGIYVSMETNFFVEPVLEGSVDSFILFVFISGIVETQYSTFITRKCNRTLDGQIDGQ